MSAAASWSYTATATLWKNLGISDGGDSLGFAAPVAILCDYEGGLSKRLASLGAEIVVKNTIEPLPMIGLYASYRKDQKNEAITLILKILKEQFYMDMF